MSGGVGPTCCDISLPSEQETLHKEICDRKSGAVVAPRRKPAALLSFRQMNALAVVVILSASGMVCAEDLAFVAFSIGYMYFISRVAFPPASGDGGGGGGVFSAGQSKVLRVYVMMAAVIGLFLPIGYILEGFFENDKEGIKAASPHVFLLASQVFMEGVAFNSRFSTPIRAFVPVFYNSRRIFTLAEWLRDEFAKEDKEFSGSVRRLMVGRALAVANMALWSFNLFGFLLPVYLPRAFDRYYNYDLHKSKDH